MTGLLGGKMAKLTFASIENYLSPYRSAGRRIRDNPAGTDRCRSRYPQPFSDALQVFYAPQEC